VTFLSTYEPFLRLTVDDKKDKPFIGKVYDFTKGGTDVMDQKISKHSVKNKSNKWKRVVWSYLVDTTRFNCFTICMETNSILYRETEREREMGSDRESIPI
jgi:hypothetical protein